MTNVNVDVDSLKAELINYLRKIPHDIRCRKELTYGSFLKYYIILKQVVDMNILVSEEEQMDLFKLLYVLAETEVKTDNIREQQNIVIYKNSIKEIITEKMHLLEESDEFGSR